MRIAWQLILCFSNSAQHHRNTMHRRLAQFDGISSRAVLGLLLLCLCLWLIPVTGSAFLQLTPLLAQGTIPPSLANITQVAIGGSHTCALTTSGDVRCWGADLSGQLGDGGSVDKLRPVAVRYLNSDVRAVSAGWQYTCALSTSSGVMCWGNNNYRHAGQNRTCAVTTSGAVKCWGLNPVGLPDDGANSIHYTPVDVPGLESGATNINLGARYACALMINGSVQCWEAFDHIGVNNARGDRQPPTVVDGLADVTAVSAGWYHACALNASGGVHCWGFNHSGQLGDGTAWSTTPVDVIEAAMLYLPLILR